MAFDPSGGLGPGPEGLGPGEAFSPSVETKPAEDRAGKKARTGPRRATGRFIDPKSVAVFCRQLSVLLEVGVPLLQALRKVAAQTTNFGLQRLINDIADEVEQGNSFSYALSKYPRVFSPLFVNVITVAERGGILDQSITNLADYLEKREALKGKVKRALTYPAITIAMALVVIVIVLTLVMPEFAKLFEEASMDLPSSTRGLINFGDFLVHWWWAIVVGIVIAVVAVQASARTTRGRYGLDRFKLRLPLFGDLIRKAAVVRFTQTFGILLASGVPILKSLDIVRGIPDNMVFAEAFRKVYEAVENGSKVEPVLRQSGVMPDIAMNMVAVGEEGGRLDSVLLRVADMYEQEVDDTVNNFATLVEPILLLVVGLIVSLIVYSVFLPYFKLGEVVLNV